MMITTILITGANGGLGKEAARQLALQPETEKIYLACRNPAKAKAAKQSLEELSGRSIFEILLLDTSDLASVKAAVASLAEPVDALIMNAGGMGGKTPGQQTAHGTTQMFAVNVLGHVVLLEELLRTNKLTQVALYAGSEAARGVPLMGMKQPKLSNSSEEEFASVIDGSYFGEKFDPMQAYGHVKYMAAMWMAAAARQHPNLRLITMSPGGTSGTEVMNDLPPVMKFLFKHVGLRLMPLFGMMHPLETGARRYLNGLTNDSFQSGKFYASKKSVLTGPVVDQGTIFEDLNNIDFQNNVERAIHRFIS